MIDEHFKQAASDEGFQDAAMKKITQDYEAKISAIAGGKFPEGIGEWSPMTPENVARANELLAIDAAKTELRRVAMTLHAEARAVLQNVFLCPADVVEAADHLYDASVAISTALNSQTVIDALKLPNK